MDMMELLLSFYHDTLRVRLQRYEQEYSNTCWPVIKVQPATGLTGRHSTRNCRTKDMSQLWIKGKSWGSAGYTEAHPVILAGA